MLLILLANWHAPEIQDQYACTLNADSGGSYHSANLVVPGLKIFRLFYSAMNLFASSSLLAVSRRTDSGVWHCGSITLAFPSLSLHTKNEDGSAVRQKAQEITKKIPTEYSNQHRR